MQQAFRLTRVARSSAAWNARTTTGLVGLNPDPNIRVNIINAQEKLLKSVKDIPVDFHYRKNVEALANFRLEKAKSITDEFELEKVIGLGYPLEHIVVEAEDEMLCVTAYAENKPWENPVFGAIDGDADKEEDEFVLPPQTEEKQA